MATNTNHFFYAIPQFRELARMPEFDYEADFDLTGERKLDILWRLISLLGDKGVTVSFSSFIYDPDVKKPWESKDTYRTVAIAELVGNEIVINPLNIDFLSVFLSIGHIYGHLVQRATPERYAGITHFLGLLKPLSIEKLQTDYKEAFPEKYADTSPDDYVGDYKADFLRYELEAFAYAMHLYIIEAGLRISSAVKKSIQTYIRTDYEELWRWASTTNVKNPDDFMNLFLRHYTQTTDGWDMFKLSPPKAPEMDLPLSPTEKLTVIRNGYDIPNVHL